MDTEIRIAQNILKTLFSIQLHYSVYSFYKMKIA